MRTTIKDVARDANVSIRTVSRVINNDNEVSEDTRKRILKSVERLSFKPNRIAQSMISGRTHAVGIIIPDITDPFFPELILAAERIARLRGYSIFLCNADRQPGIELEYVDLLNQRQVDGLIIAGSRLDVAGLEIAANGQPAVIMSPYDIPNALLCSIDGFSGGQVLGEYLISLGHRNIGYVEGTWGSTKDQRYMGLVSAMQASGLSTDDVLAGAAHTLSFEDGFQVGREILARRPELTALVCYNDVIAIGVMQGCRAAGLHVPDNISIAGFDDIPEASRHDPGLTTLRIDRCRLGEQMMTRLLDAIEKKDLSTERIVWTGQLVVRQSCADLRP